MSPMPSPPPLKEEPTRIEICRTGDDLARHAAQFFVAQAGRALGSAGRFSVALSGGGTPRGLYALLPRENFAHQVVWPAMHVFFTDERCVPPDHADSNYAMVQEALLSRVPIEPANIHRMRGESDDPEAAAAEYERTLLGHFGGPPRFDLVLLGMGEDGHTASLFPGDAALSRTDRLVTVGTHPTGARRLTLTLPVLNAAHVVMVLVSGQSKADIARRVLGASARDENLPIRKVRPAQGRLVWLLDEAAASTLEEGEPDDQG